MGKSAQSSANQLLLALAALFILAPLRLLSQERSPAAKAKTALYDPFFTAGNFINPAGYMQPGTVWASSGIRIENDTAKPFLNYRQDGNKFSGIFRLSAAPSQARTLLAPQAAIFARISTGGKISLYPFASFSFDICRSAEMREFMLGTAAFCDWKLLGISGYAGFANEHGAAKGSGAIAGLGWNVRKEKFEVRHLLDIDFRTGARRISVETSLPRFGMLYQSEKSQTGKTTFLGARISTGSKSSATALSLWAKAGCDGKIGIGKRWRPTVGITLKSRIPSHKLQKR